MAEKAKVEIAVACGYNQSYMWWGAIMGRLLGEAQNVDILGLYPYGTALPDYIKNKAVGGQLPAYQQALESKRRNELTDSNRNAGVASFLNRGADWLMWLDDDTIPPQGFITRLLELGRDFVGGVYFLGAEPYNPIAYYRRDDGLYSPITKYAHAALIQVDSIGMGCTLIHRSVYERIMAGHEVWQRPTGSLLAIPKKQISTAKYVAPKWKSAPAFRQGDELYQITHLTRPDPEDNRHWPFYAMENSRTEDHHFCELAANVGIQPYLDTSITCEHIKPVAITRQHYLDQQEKQ